MLFSNKKVGWDITNINHVFLQITHAMSSILAALTAATMGTPADVIKTRVMNQPLDNNGVGRFHLAITQPTYHLLFEN